VFRENSLENLFGDASNLIFEGLGFIGASSEFESGADPWDFHVMEFFMTGLDCREDLFPLSLQVRSISMKVGFHSIPTQDSLTFHNVFGK
jgi:hypothetical protein